MAKEKRAEAKPGWVYTTSPSDRRQVIAIRRFEHGFYPLMREATEAEAKSKAESLNERGATPEMIEAYLVGSMFGWHVPGARLAE
jgi:hypothetical protein